MAAGEEGGEEDGGVQPGGKAKLCPEGWRRREWIQQENFGMTAAALLLKDYEEVPLLWERKLWRR